MVAAKKVLIVDSNIDIQEILEEQLETNNEFITESVGNGHLAIEKTSLNYYDIIIMDIELPDINGCDVCRVMRKNGVKSPIVMLSKSSADVDTILGLDSGANDYIVKPFNQVNEPFLFLQINFIWHRSVKSCNVFYSA